MRIGHLHGVDKRDAFPGGKIVEIIFRPGEGPDDRAIRPRRAGIRRSQRVEHRQKGFAAKRIRKSAAGRLLQDADHIVLMTRVGDVDVGKSQDSGEGIAGETSLRRRHFR